MQTMVPPHDTLPATTATELIQPDGRPAPAFRSELRRIPSLRNAVSVVSVYVQTLAVIVLAVRLGPWSWPIALLLIGRANAQFAGLMHEAAHRLLFKNRRANDLVGRWLLGYPTFTSIDAYRRVHMAHHREEFGPDEPDMALYRGYPISDASFRRKMIRDVTGRTGWKLLRRLPLGLRSKDARIRNTAIKIVIVQAVLLAGSIAVGSLVAVPVLLAPAVPHRLAGDQPAALDRRARRHDARRRIAARRPTRSASARSARFFMTPYNLGWHLAHHVDSGRPVPQPADAPRRAARGGIRRRPRSSTARTRPSGAPSAPADLATPVDGRSARRVGNLASTTWPGRFLLRR